MEGTKKKAHQESKTNKDFIYFLNVYPKISGLSKVKTVWIGHLLTTYSCF